MPVTLAYSIKNSLEIIKPDKTFSDFDAHYTGNANQKI